MIIQILGLLIVGLVIGALARLLRPGKQTLSLIATMGLGVVGAIIGGVIGGLFNDSTNPFELNFLGFVFAVIAAFLLVGIAEAATGKKSSV